MTSRHRDKNTKRKENYLINHRFSIAQKYDVNLALLIFYLNGTEKVKTRNKYIILFLHSIYMYDTKTKGVLPSFEKTPETFIKGGVD